MPARRGSVFPLVVRTESGIQNAWLLHPVLAVRFSLGLGTLHFSIKWKQ